MNVLKICYAELIKIRGNLERKYGQLPENMAGKCIEGADSLAAELCRKGIKARAYQVWALYEYYSTCTVYCYEEHWIVMVETGSGRLYLDPTFNQFQPMMSRALPKIYIGAVLPNWLLPREPGRAVLNRCGWNDFYNGRNWDNSFDYWSYLSHPQNIAIQQRLAMLQRSK